MTHRAFGVVYPRFCGQSAVVDPVFDDTEHCFVEILASLGLKRFSGVLNSAEGL